MVSITVSIPSKTKELMKEFPEMNWSGFVRKPVEEKVNKVSKLEKLNKELKTEQDTTDWSVKLQRASITGRLEALKRKGLI